MVLDGDMVRQNDQKRRKMATWLPYISIGHHFKNYTKIVLFFGDYIDPN